MNRENFNLPANTEPILVELSRPPMTLDRARSQQILVGVFFAQFYPGKWPQGQKLLRDVTDNDLQLARRMARLDEVDALMAGERISRPTPDQRLYVWLRDGGKCRYCVANASPDYFEPDHYQPFAHGGQTITANLVCACRECNRAKNMNHGEAFDRLAADPGFIKYRRALYGQYMRKPYSEELVILANEIMYPQG